jgi:hypothetical protein
MSDSIQLPLGINLPGNISTIKVPKPTRSILLRQPINLSNNRIDTILNFNGSPGISSSQRGPIPSIGNSAMNAESSGLFMVKG